MCCGLYCCLRMNECLKPTPPRTRRTRAIKIIVRVATTNMLTAARCKMAAETKDWEWRCLRAPIVLKSDERVEHRYRRSREDKRKEERERERGEERWGKRNGRREHKRGSGEGDEREGESFFSRARRRRSGTSPIALLARIKKHSRSDCL